MAFPTTSVIEQFTGTSGTSPPNANWTNVYNGIQIQSNQGAGSQSGDSNLTSWDTSTFGPDMEGYFTIGTIDPSGGLGFGLRTTTLSISTVDGYLCHVDTSTSPDTFSIDEVLNGGTTNISSTTTNVVAGEKIGAEIIGNGTNNIKMYHYTGGAWSQKLTGTDTTYQSAGYLMLYIYGTTARVDDLGGGTVVTGGSVVGPLIDGRLINNSHLIHGRLIR